MGANLTRSEFKEKVFRLLMEAVEEGETQKAQRLENYSEFYFQDNDITIKKAEFALRLRDELNKRMQNV